MPTNERDGGMENSPCGVHTYIQSAIAWIEDEDKNERGSPEEQDTEGLASWCGERVIGRTASHLQVLFPCDST